MKIHKLLESKKLKKPIKESYWYGIPEVEFEFGGAYSDTSYIHYKGLKFSTEDLGVEEAERDYFDELVADGEIDLQDYRNEDEAFQDYFRSNGDNLKYDLENEYEPIGISDWVKNMLGKVSTFKQLENTISHLKGKSIIPHHLLDTYMSKALSLKQEALDNELIDDNEYEWDETDDKYLFIDINDELIEWMDEAVTKIVNESVHKKSMSEDVFANWKPNTSFKHIKDIYDKVRANGYEYVNNEREEFMAAVKKAEAKGYKPEQCRQIKDWHRDIWQHNRKTESLKKSLSEELWDKDRVSELVAYYLDRSNVPVNTLANSIFKQMEKEGSKLPYNITDFYDCFYIAVNNYKSESDSISEGAFNGGQEVLDESKSVKESSERYLYYPRTPLTNDRYACGPEFSSLKDAFVCALGSGYEEVVKEEDTFSTDPYKEVYTVDELKHKFPIDLVHFKKHLSDDEAKDAISQYPDYTITSGAMDDFAYKFTNESKSSIKTFGAKGKKLSEASETVKRYKVEYYADNNGEKLETYIYADNKEEVRKQLVTKTKSEGIDYVMITAMIPETVPASYRDWDLKESSSDGRAKNIQEAQVSAPRGIDPSLLKSIELDMVKLIRSKGMDIIKVDCFGTAQGDIKLSIGSYDSAKSIKQLVDDYCNRKGYTVKDSLITSNGVYSTLTVSSPKLESIDEEPKFEYMMIEFAETSGAPSDDIIGNAKGEKFYNINKLNKLLIKADKAFREYWEANGGEGGYDKVYFDLYGTYQGKEVKLHAGRVDLGDGKYGTQEVTFDRAEIEEYFAKEAKLSGTSNESLTEASGAFVDAQGVGKVKVKNTGVKPYSGDPVRVNVGSTANPLAGIDKRKSSPTSTDKDNNGEGKGKGGTSKGDGNQDKPADTAKGATDTDTNKPQGNDTNNGNDNGKDKDSKNSKDSKDSKEPDKKDKKKKSLKDKIKDRYIAKKEHVYKIKSARNQKELEYETKQLHNDIKSGRLTRKEAKALKDLLAQKRKQFNMKPVKEGYEFDWDNDDEITYNYEDEEYQDMLDDQGVREGKHFIENGNDYYWTKRVGGSVHLDFDNWAVWEAKNMDDEIEEYFVVEEDTEFIDWGPVDTAEEALEFLQSKVDDWEDEEGGEIGWDFIGESVSNINKDTDRITMGEIEYLKENPGTVIRKPHYKVSYNNYYNANDNTPMGGHFTVIENRGKDNTRVDSEKELQSYITRRYGKYFDESLTEDGEQLPVKFNDDELVEFPKLDKFEKELNDYLNSKGSHEYVYAFKGDLKMEIYHGDWKHEHCYNKYLIEKFFDEKGIEVEIDVEWTDDSEGDVFSAGYVIYSDSLSIDESKELVHTKTNGGCLVKSNGGSTAYNRQGVCLDGSVKDNAEVNEDLGNGSIELFEIVPGQGGSTETDHYTFPTADKAKEYVKRNGLSKEDISKVVGMSIDELFN